MNNRIALEFIATALRGAVNAADYARAGNLDDLRQNCAAARQVLRRLAASIGNGNDGPTEVDRDLALVAAGLRDWGGAEAALEAIWRL